ncbi:fibronectin type III-like domain-containing protein [Mycena sanguinolenta]|nr:fibronectin type III-like domain-containing protein [Mycena sanguinolenta]
MYVQPHRRENVLLGRGYIDLDSDACFASRTNSLLLDLSLRKVLTYSTLRPARSSWFPDGFSNLWNQCSPSKIRPCSYSADKLPVSFPQAVGTTPDFYSYLYVLNTPVPLWSFGHGLSYTLSYLLATSATLSEGDALSTATSNMRFVREGGGRRPPTADPLVEYRTFVYTNFIGTVHHTDPVDGKEVVQVYIADSISSVFTANQQLVGFQKVDIPAGGSATVTIPVLSSQLAVWTLQNSWVVEPGVFTLKVGTSDQFFAQANLTVT